MTRVRTGSRLHFGLFRLPPPAPWPASERFFGGLGMMIDEPAVTVTAHPAESWQVDGPWSDRVSSVIRNLWVAYPDSPCRGIRVKTAAPQHAGFGSGTQIAMAVAAALLGGLGPLPSVDQLARVLGRGKRSAIGVYGFAAGGFLVDHGKSRPDELAPPPTRIEFPDSWRIVLVTPKAETTWAGIHERRAFAELPPSPDLQPFAEAAVLPPLLAGDLPAFGPALTEFNARSGDAYAAVQGGRYSSPATAAAVQRLLDAGAASAGQSSWGPTAFGVVADPDRGRHVAEQVSREFDRVSLVAPRREGFEIYSGHEVAWPTGVD